VGVVRRWESPDDCGEPNLVIGVGLLVIAVLFVVALWVVF